MASEHHTEQCLQDTAEWERIKNEYESRWPHYCRTCMGWGALYSGIEYGKPVVDPCPDCSDKGRCPRCGHQIYSEPSDWDDDTTCPECGWREGATEGIPEAPECLCWLKKEDVWKAWEDLWKLGVIQLARR